MSFCNECWNGSSFVGQSLPARSGTPNSEYYYDYSVRAAAIFKAMRSDPYYTQSAFDLVLNAQTGVNYTMDAAAARAHPDSIEMEDYTYENVSSYATDTALWQPDFVEIYDKVTDPTDPSNFYQSVTDYQGQNVCGAAGSAACGVNVYEWGSGTLEGTIDQTHLDYITAGAGTGVISALQPLLNMQYFGITADSYFSLAEYQNKALNGLLSKVWGIAVDMGGATNNMRPQYLGLSLINQSIIGPMYACPISNNVTYNFAGSATNGTSVPPGVPSTNSVPYLYSFCFENGNNRSMVLINTDLSASHTVSFAGTNIPSGTVTQRQYAPSSPDLLNESPSGTSSDNAVANVALSSTTLNSPSSITLPPMSATALDFTSGSSTNAGTAATPIFSLAPGAYATAQTVSISDSTSGATIYYTTDGSTPTTSSAKYAGPISVSTTETINAIAVASSFTNSAVASATYTITQVTAAPVLSIATGTYTIAQVVSISDATPGAVIYYTADGSIPTTSSTIYPGPFSVGATLTINAIAVAPGYSSSAVTSATYTIVISAAAPTFSPAAGTYTSAQSVAINSSAAGSSIYYTTDGTAPTTASAKYNAAISVNTTQTLKAIVAIGTTSSVKAAASSVVTSPVATASYTITTKAATPIFSLASGTYSGAQTVTISDSTTGATIYYTTDGSSPTTSSPKYAGAINVTATETLHAMAVANNYMNSNIAAVTYTVTTVVTTPTFSLASGSYNGAQTVAIADSTTGSAIYYTTNGTTPTTSSTKYSAAIQVSVTETIRAIAVRSGYTNSAVATAAYTISDVVDTPTFSLVSGTYNGAQTVTLHDATAGVAIYYTTNGKSPTTASTLYTAAIKVAATETLHAIAVLKNYKNSSVATAAYTITYVTDAPTFSLKTGTYSGPQTVTLTDATLGATIYYTSNGSAPTTASTKYVGAIKVSKSETIHAIAVLKNYKNSMDVAADYTITYVAATPVFSLANGTYDGTQTVTIGDATAGAAIYYTMNGNTPTKASTKYSVPFKVSTSETVHAIAVAKDYTNSAVATAQYKIVTVVATPTFSHATGTYASAIPVAIRDTTADTTIYYTVDGTTPTTASKKYTAAITVSASETIQAIAVRAGMTNSVVAKETYTITTALPTFSAGFAGSQIMTTGNVSLAGDELRLTDGGSAEISAAWFAKKVSVSKFVTDFTFQIPKSVGDGFTFAIQNSPKGVYASGGAGSSLGYGSIPNSVAIKFDLFNNAGEGSNSTGIYTNGAIPTVPSVSIPTGEINLHSGHVLHAHLVYDGKTLTETITDMTTKTLFTHTYTINIASVIGSASAYVGFTASTGAFTSVQNILSWTFTE
jgi:hypothetical protein